MHATSTLWVKGGERYKLLASESSAIIKKIKAYLFSVRFNNIGARSLKLAIAPKQPVK
jgi:hypothetical protein